MLSYKNIDGKRAVVVKFSKGLSPELSNLATMGTYSAEQHYQREKLIFYGNAFDKLVGDSKDLRPPVQNICAFFLSKFVGPGGPTDGVSAKKFGTRGSYLKMLSEPGLFGDRKRDSTGKKYISQATRLKLLQHIDQLWFNSNVDIMQNILRAKFMLPPFKEVLLSTGNLPIYEQTLRGENIWCRSTKGVPRMTGNREVSRWGLLGDLLMEIRALLQNRAL